MTSKLIIKCFGYLFYGILFTVFLYSAMQIILELSNFDFVELSKHKPELAVALRESKIYGINWLIYAINEFFT